MIKAGEEWGESCAAPADVVVEGTDADLARAVAAHPGALIRFVPDAASDVARAVGLAPNTEPRGWAVPMDALQVDDGGLAVNMILLGTPPERASWRTPDHELSIDGRATRAFAVVVAIGQFHDGADLVPRGHPGDQHGELQIYAVRRREHRALRRRTATGTHLPHPDITQRRLTAHATTTITTPAPIPREVDGVGAGATTATTITVVPNAYRLLL